MKLFYSTRSFHVLVIWALFLEGVGDTVGFRGNKICEREREKDKESIPTVHNFQGIFFLFFFSHFPFLHEVPNNLEEEKKKAMCDLLSWTKGDYLSPASLKHCEHLTCNDET